MSEGEKVELRFEKVERKTKSGDIVQDLKDGYIYFNVGLDANGKKISVEKRVRLDKPEKAEYPRIQARA